MKTKRRTFWSFFTRIGAGFLAFWLAVMAVFTVLLSQQRAKNGKQIGQADGRGYRFFA
ncbi:MAG: hypothetical protein U0M30_08865 [Agathobaculum butyriciproducens]